MKKIKETNEAKTEEEKEEEEDEEERNPAEAEKREPGGVLPAARTSDD